MSAKSPRPVFETLRAEIARIEANGRPRKGVLPFGVETIDRKLPGGGLVLGALHEVGGGGDGAVHGAASALFAAGIAARTKGKVLWCVTRADLARMKADSLLVNTSRAELIESGALHAVLSANPTRQAALDVFDSEPANLDNEPLLALPNVLATPHLGYVEQSSYELYFRKAFENVLAFAEGRPQHLVMPALG